MNAVKIENISYKVHNKMILRNISFGVDERESFALIGENGSGKTTLIDLVLGDINPTQGSVKLFGKSNTDFKDVGVVYDRSPLFPMLKTREIIKYFCHLNKVNYKSILKKGYIETFQLEKLVDSYIAYLSQGEKQRLGVLIALIRNPRLLILDEPFSNLDPIIVNHIWNVIKTEERTVLFSTHNWKEIEKLADKIVLINKGQMMCEPLSPRDLLNKLPAKQKLVVHMSEELKSMYKAYASYLDGDNLVLFFDGNDLTLKKLGEHTNNFSVQDVSVQDVYLYLSKN